MLPLPPRSTLFPYTTLFRSGIDIREIIACVVSRIAIRIPMAILACGALASLGGCVSTSSKGQPTIQGQSMQYMLADIDQIRAFVDRKSTRLNSSHLVISYAV